MPQAQPPIPGTHRELWLTARPTGMPGPEHFGLVETAVPQPGQVVGEVVGEVVRAPGGGPWSVGDLVLHRSGFREEAVVAALVEAAAAAEADEPGPDGRPPA